MNKSPGVGKSRKQGLHPDDLPHRGKLTFEIDHRETGLFSAIAYRVTPVLLTTATTGVAGDPSDGGDGVDPSSSNVSGISSATLLLLLLLLLS